MVNASLNWASIVGIVLAVGGALLYFMRSFKPALARDYDVFFAAIGLLCGGILFFQGWRLDPILQFGQFLLAGTTVFFAYESVRLRGVATEQARRSAYFDDEPAPAPRGPGGDLRGGWDDGYDRFDEPQPLRRRFGGRDAEMDERPEDDFYRPRRSSRAAIPEQAASRRPRPESDWDQPDESSRRMARFRAGEQRNEQRPDFGERRQQREEQRRGSRPAPSSSRFSDNADDTRSSGQQGIPKGSPMRSGAEDAAYSSAPPARPGSPRPGSSRPTSSRPPAADGTAPGAPEQPGPSTRPSSGSGSSRPAPRSSRPRDNSSRFDD